MWFIYYVFLLKFYAIYIHCLSCWQFWPSFLWMCCSALDSCNALRVISAPASSGGAQRSLTLSGVWHHWGAPSNHWTNSQQAQPFPMIMNGNVQHLPIHFFFFYPFFLSQALGANKTRRVKFNWSLSGSDLVCHTPCCHGRNHKGLNWTEMPMQHRRSKGGWG